MALRRPPVTFAILALLSVTVLLYGCANRTDTKYAPADTAADNDAVGETALLPGVGPWNLTLFHINDTHTSFLPEPATWRDDHALIGGVAALKSHLDEQRAQATASLTFDAGDFMTGNPVGEIESDGVIGGGWIAMLNTLGIDAGVVGNHDFDQGRANARRIVAMTDWPLMALDLLNEQGELELDQPPVIFERNGLRVGVIGVTCAGLFGVTADSRVEGLQLVDQTLVVRDWIEKLDPETDLLVLITHNGIRDDEALARELGDSGLDVIVGGHSHTRTNEPRLVGDILVVQAGGYMQNLGRLDLRVADDRVVSYQGRLIPVLAEGRTTTPQLADLVGTWAARVDAEYGRQIGNLLTEWRRDSQGESNVGDWICDAMLAAADTDVSLLNSGTLRRNFLAGPITRLDIHQLVPFGNLLEVFEIEGRALAEICRVNAEGAEDGHHGILQVGGLRYVYTVEDERVEMIEITVGGEPLDPDRVYTVACPDYVAMKADIYMGLAEKPTTHSVGMTVTEAIIAAVETAGEIEAHTDGRIARR